MSAILVDLQSISGANWQSFESAVSELTQCVFYAKIFFRRSTKTSKKINLIWLSVQTARAKQNIGTGKKVMSGVCWKNWVYGSKKYFRSKQIYMSITWYHIFEETSKICFDFMIRKKCSLKVRWCWQRAKGRITLVSRLTFFAPNRLVRLQESSFSIFQICRRLPLRF